MRARPPVAATASTSSPARGRASAPSRSPRSRRPQPPPARDRAPTPLPRDRRPAPRSRAPSGRPPRASVKPTHAARPPSLPRAVHADRDPDLARGRAGQQVRERHELAELLLADPAAARDVLLAEVADVRDGPPNEVSPSRSAARKTSATRAAGRPGDRPEIAGRAEPGLIQRFREPALPRRSRLPERLVGAGERVGRAREDEQEVGEPVQIDGDERIDVVLAAPRRASPARRGGRRCGRRGALPQPACRPGARSSSARAASSLNASHSCLEPSTSPCSTRSLPSTANGTHRSAPTSNSSFWILPSGGPQLGRAVAREHDAE